MTWLRVALMVAAIWFLVAMPLVAWKGVQAVRCGYLAAGYSHPEQYGACLRGDL